MIFGVPVVHPNDTIGAIEHQLTDDIHSLESIDYIYVVDCSKRLVGVASVKDILRQTKTTRIEDIMVRELVTAHPHTHQERVAYLALKNNLKSIPIIDQDGLFLGVVSSDAILGITYRETRDDLMRLAGIGRGKMETDDIMKISIGLALRHRLPWLFMGLVGGMLMAQVIGFFENTLQQNLILATFIPLIVYMSDAIGTQMEAFIIRDLAMAPRFEFGKYFSRQSLIVVLMGCILSAILFLISVVLYQSFAIAEVLGIALFAAILSSLITGLVIPYFFSRLHFDPANASGPMATMLQDLLSVTIYFIVASWLL